MTESGSARPLLAIIVVNYRTSALLEANLAQLSSDVEHAITVVVDNYSSRAERASVEALGRRHDWTIVASDTNRGFGAGMNLGVRRATERGATSYLLLNPDAQIDSRNLERLRSLVDADSDVLVAPRILKGDGSVWFDGVSLDLETGRMHSRRSRRERPSRHEPWLTGACLLLSKEMWERTGGFDERYFMYWEDVDLSYRARLAGGRLVVDESASAIHEVGASQPAHAAHIPKARAKSTAYYFYNIRNRLVFAGTHLDDRDRRRWRRTAVLQAYDVLMQGGRRQFLHPGPPLRAAAAGLVEGWRMSGPPRPRRPTRQSPRVPS